MTEQQRKQFDDARKRAASVVNDKRAYAIRYGR